MDSGREATPDDVEALKAALIVARAEAAAARAQQSDDQALIAHLKLQIEKLNRDRYGPRSERTARLLDQLELTLEELETAATEDELAAEMAAAKTTKVASFKRDVFRDSVRTAPVALVRSIDANDSRREKSASLVLRLRLKNVSRDQEFAPLDPRFLREQGAALDRSTIVRASGNGINLFPLAVDSEWSIEGQSFNVLKPGETVETVIASEPGVADKLTDEMVWRVRLRIGTYRTDVLGVRFNKHEIEEAGSE